MKLSDVVKQFEVDEGWEETSIQWEGEEVVFQVKKKTTILDEEYCWLNRKDQESVMEGLVRRIHRLVLADGEAIPLESVQAFPFDLILSITNAINVVQGIEEVQDLEEEPVKKKH